MKKRIPLFLALIALCVIGLSACSKTNNPNSSEYQATEDSTSVHPDSSSSFAPSDVPEIGFILYTGEIYNDRMTLEEMMELETTATAAHWNINTGSVEIEKAPIMIIKGGNHCDAIASWDGNKSILIGSNRESIEKSTDFDYKDYHFQVDNIVVEGHEYQFELTPEGDCMIREGSSPESKTINIAQGLVDINTKFSDLSYLKSEFDGTQLKIAFIIYGQNTANDSKLICVTINPKDDTVNWSSTVTIPEQYMTGFLKAEPYTVQFVKNNLYFSGWDTIAYLNLDTNKVLGLENITSALDSVFPDAKRTCSGMVEDTSPAGSSKEAAIFSMNYYETNSTNCHYLYYAVQGSQLLGAMSLNLLEDGATITTYNTQLELLQTINISHLMLKNIPLAFQSVSYP